MNKEFHSVSWIDHGYDNAKKSNREDLVCDGLDSTSKYFSADLWEANGLKYFWNCFYEDSSAFPNLGFNSSITLPYPGFGDAFPVPVYWRHPTRSGKLVHWRTRSTTDFSDDSWWNYFFSEERIHDFISQRGTNVIHCYAARIDSTNGFYLYKDGHFSIDPAFNSFLSRLAEHRRNGEIYLATIRELLDYRTALEQVDYVVLPDGKVKIHNLGSRRIIDLSMCIAANSVFVSSKKIKLKHLNGDLVFWFDLDAGEEVVISSGE